MDKFKTGDMVTIVHKNGYFYERGLEPGTVGTIIRYYGDYQNWTENGKLGTAKNSWEIQVPAIGIAYCEEECLKLIPGNPDCLEVGSWDECPWTPFKETFLEDEKTNFMTDSFDI